MMLAFASQKALVIIGADQLTALLAASSRSLAEWCSRTYQGRAGSDMDYKNVTATSGW